MLGGGVTLPHKLESQAPAKTNELPAKAPVTAGLSTGWQLRWIKQFVESRSLPTRTFALLWFGLWTLLAVPNYIEFARDRSRLSTVALDLTRGLPREAMPYRLQQAVEQRVSTTARGRVYNVATRGFLRQSAWHTWVAAEGTCGDGARLLVELLGRLGFRATRINLHNDVTGFAHTAVAFEDDGKWWLLDTISGPAAFRRWIGAHPRRLDGAIRITPYSEGGSRFIVSNPFFTRFSYLDAARVTGGTISVTLLAKPPPILVTLLENPDLMMAGGKLLLALLLFPFVLLLRRSGRWQLATALPFCSRMAVSSRERREAASEVGA